MTPVMPPLAFGAYKIRMETAEQNARASDTEPETRRSGPACTVSACLERDHRMIDAILNDVEALVRDRDLAAAAGAFAQFQTRLDNHIEVEEDILFPVFEAVTACNGPTSVMCREHAELRRLIAVISVSLEAPEHGDPLPLISELAQMLGSHNVKEERILYPRADGSLSDATRATLVARMASRLEGPNGESSATSPVNQWKA